MRPRKPWAGRPAERAAEALADLPPAGIRRRAAGRSGGQALDPLADFDAAHDAALLPTLQTYLELNGSVAAVAEELGLHRNSVRYRLSQIVELTGYDPALTADRVHLWLALTVRRLGSDSGSQG